MSLFAKTDAVNKSEPVTVIIDGFTCLQMRQNAGSQYPSIGAATMLECLSQNALFMVVHCTKNVAAYYDCYSYSLGFYFVSQFQLL